MRILRCEPPLYYNRAEFANAVYHAVPIDPRGAKSCDIIRALCGTARAIWSARDGDRVTCRRCLAIAQGTSQGGLGVSQAREGADEVRQVGDAARRAGREGEGAACRTKAEGSET